MKKAIFEQVHEYIKLHQLLDAGQTIIIGLSGGPDSVCLTHMLARLKDTYGLRLIAVHIDHQWRTDSHNDVAFCQKIARDLSIEFIHKRADQIVVPIPQSGSLEERGRILRQTFFYSLADEYSADHIALGHHQNDQVETFLIRLIRGSSIAGLGAMRPKTGLYIRPLLNITKDDIYTYLAQHNMTFLTDPTNREVVQLRNRVRHIAIPALENTDKRFFKNTLHSIQHIQEAHDFIARQATTALAQCLIIYENKDWLDLSKFFSIDQYLQREVLLQWLCQSSCTFTLTTSFLKEIFRYLKHGRSTSHTLGRTWKIVKKQHKARITPIDQ